MAAAPNAATTCTGGGTLTAVAGGGTITGGAPPAAPCRWTSPPTRPYAIDVTNLGPTAVTGVEVVDTLPAGMAFGAAGTGWSCGEAAGTVTCTLPTLDVAAPRSRSP